MKCLFLSLAKSAVAAILLGATGVTTHAPSVCDSTELLQTSITKPVVQQAAPADVTLLFGSQSTLREAAPHTLQLRNAILVGLAVFAMYFCFQFVGLGERLYNWCFETGKHDKEAPKEGCGRMTMQLSSLAWKNVVINSRTELPFCELPCCGNCLNGCCLQMVCPILNIFLVTALPVAAMHLTGASKSVQVDFPMKFGRDYEDVGLKPQQNIQDLLFQEPSLTGLADGAAMASLLQDPLQSLWHPMGEMPQGACFCRTLGIIGPRASEFQSFATQSYASWTQKSAEASGNPLKFLDRTAARLQCPSNFTGTIFRVFGSQAEVDNLLGHYDYASVPPLRSPRLQDRLCGLIVFENDPVLADVPRFVVRTNLSGMDALGISARKATVDRKDGMDNGPLSWYLLSGFLSMQDMVQRYVSDRRVGSKLTLPEPSFVPLPVPPYHHDDIKIKLSNTIAAPDTATNTFTVTVMLIAYHMIRERNTKQKEFMRLMGLYDSSLVLSWLTLFALMNFVCSMGCSILVYGTLVEKSDFLIMFLVFYLCSLATISLGMTISSLFSSERLGALLAFAAYSVLGLIYHGVVPGGEMMPSQQSASRADMASPWLLYILSLFPNIAFVLCLRTYFHLDQGKFGCTMETLNWSREHYSVGGGLSMLAFDVLFWAVVHSYLEQVIPHQVGSVRPWYFPVTPSYWRECFGWTAKDPDHTKAAEYVSEEQSREDEGLFESEDTAHLQQLRQRNSVLKVRDLHKTYADAFGAKVHAVNGLNLTMYPGECFCLLGHNGAGKTTAMGMITGMVQPTAGWVQVLGLSMPEDRVKVRSSMGFCMQQNILWDNLTVREHILFFGALRGMSPSMTAASCDAVLAKVELLQKQHSWASALSGGMKRKLNVASALLGEANVIMLDEPTAGMDPHTRRRLWGVLKQARTECIMCLTTHYMDEADELGDRVCIMVHGKAACNGTNSFLKKQLGCGYILNFVKASEDVDAEPICTVVATHCGADVAEAASAGRELRLHVPFAAAKAFPALMRELDAKLESLGLESYGVGVSDLEDVFLKVANGDRVSGPQEPPPERQTSFATAGKAVTQAGRGEPGIWGQFLGLFMRRVNYGKRDSKMFFCQLLVPVLIMVVFLALSNLQMLNLSTFGRVDLDTAGFGGSGEAGPALVTVGVAGGAPDDLARGWQQGDIPGVSAVQLAAVPAAPNLSWIPASANRERFEAEAAFANQAYSNVYGRAGARSKQAPPPQFGGVLYSGDRVTLFPNSSATCSAPALLNMHFAAAMQASAVPGAPLHMEVISEPLQRTKQEQSMISGFSTFAMGLTVMSALSFVATGIAGFVTMEKEMNVKHQLMVSGTSRSAYWLSNFAFDSVFGLSTVVTTLIVLAVFGFHNWCSYPTINATVALLALYIPAVCAFSYFWSHFFESSGTALVGVLLIGLFVGSGFLEVSHALLLFEKTRKWGQVALWISRAVVPSVCVGDGLLNLAYYRDISEVFGLSPFSGQLFGTQFCTPLQPGRCVVNAGDDCIMLIMDTVLYTVLFVVGDWLSENPSFWRTPPKFREPDPSPRPLDDRVLAERARVARLDPATQVLMVDGVTKVYEGGKGPVHAVRGVSFAVEAGNIFGLLGTNGAGKTTTFKMICGQLLPTSGRIFVDGKNVAEELSEVRRHIGYCPQFDALWDLMTVQEHLEVYSSVKGLSGPARRVECAEKLRTMGLTEYRDSRAGELSGGNKRKLSTALALIREPEVIFLDEPSAGMDPMARRKMWEVIQNVALNRKSSAVVLTTHSMEEADALCTRIGIQCSGQLQCLGTPQQLKAQFSTGLELNVRLEVPTQEESRKLCEKWGVEPGSSCAMQRARDLVLLHFGSPELCEKAPPQLWKAGTTLLLALAEWCLQEERARAVQSFLEELSGGKDKATCVEAAAASLRFKLAGNCPGGGPLPYGELFERLERKRQELRLADFQLSQGTLEHTFNRLAAEDMALTEGREAEEAQEG